MIDRDELDRRLVKGRSDPRMTEAELQAQRDSWGRGEMALGLDRDEAEWQTQHRNPLTIPNAYFANCTRCGADVEPEAGRLLHDLARGWVCVCRECHRTPQK